MTQTSTRYARQTGLRWRGWSFFTAVLQSFPTTLRVRPSILINGQWLGG